MSFYINDWARQNFRLKLCVAFVKVFRTIGLPLRTLQKDQRSNEVGKSPSLSSRYPLCFRHVLGCHWYFDGTAGTDSAQRNVGQKDEGQAYRDAKSQEAH